MVASVILNGDLVESACEETPNRLRIAIDGKFRDFEWVDFENDLSTNTDEEVNVRVVIQDKKPKSLIVTVYTHEYDGSENITEVEYEIW